MLEGVDRMRRRLACIGVCVSLSPRRLVRARETGEQTLYIGFRLLGKLGTRRAKALVRDPAGLLQDVFAR